MNMQESVPHAPNGEPSDQSLLQRLCQGSQDAAAQLYCRYAHRLRALAEAQCSPDLARRVDADDLVQSIFGSFFRGASKGYYEVPEGEELWKLFLVIALNKIRAKGKYHRAARRDVRMTVGSDHFDALPVSVGNPEDGEVAFLRLAVAEALEKLPPQHKQIVTLRMEGHEVREIAELAGRSHRTVERILQQARDRLSQLLKGE
jgi:RNA polymerase sigma-70 factor (ECF subfamily)